MKFQLGFLLLVVLFVSLPSVVFSQPPLSAVQPGETSQTAPTAETVNKSWKGPVFGLGLGLGAGGVTADFEDVTVDTGLFRTLPVKVRLGYGLSEHAVLYGSLNNVYLSAGGSSDWAGLYGMLGMIFLDRPDKRGYGFLALGAAFESGPPRPIYFRGGSGFQVYPGLFLELAGTLEYSSYEGGSSTTAYLLDVTFNYHFY